MRAFAFPFCLLALVSACVQQKSLPAEMKLAESELRGDEAVDVTFVHDQTGMHFPKEVAAFTRGEITRYNSDGSNIGVAYNQLGLKYNLAITVYLYPTHRSFEAEIESLSEMLESQYADAGFEWAQRDRAEVTQGDQSLDAWSGVGLFQKQMPLGRVEPWATVSYLMRVPQGFLKYRISMPQSYGQEGLQRMMEFLHELTWPNSFAA